MPSVRPSVRPSVDRPPSSPLPLPLAAMPANGVGGICSLLVSPREVRELGEIYSTGGTGVRGKVRKHRMYSWAKDGRQKKLCIFIIPR